MTTDMVALAVLCDILVALVVLTPPTLEADAYSLSYMSSSELAFT
jgi:hypothetical protein